MDPTPADIRVLLFDVGGVLVELSGVETMRGWLGGKISMEELWSLWLRSAAVRQFETGQVDAARFAVDVTAEFGLAVEPGPFLESFTGWPTRLYAGTLEMLDSIPRSYQRALLSNSNALHWPRVMIEMGLGSAFDQHFVSHLTGRIKPDEDAFRHVVESLGCAPNEVLFLDDNTLNTEAAKSLGMHAKRVQGAQEARRVLAELGIIEGAA